MNSLNVRRALQRITATLSLSAGLAALPVWARPTDEDPFGVRPYETCEQVIRTNLTDAVDSLNELDARMPAVPPEKNAYFEREDPVIFEVHDPARMKALFDDPYFNLWTIHNSVRRLAESVRQFALAEQRTLSAAERLSHMSRLIPALASAFSDLNLAATGRAEEAGPRSPRILTDEQISTYTENLQGIALYLADHGRCAATLP